MKTSTQGIELIKLHEGLRLASYRCSAKVLTVGYGHTGSDVYEGMTITEAEAVRLLQKDLLAAEIAVNAECRQLPQNRFDALVSFVFNVGVAAFKSSTLLKYIQNSPNDKRIHHEFLRWVYANGKMSAGLEKRRVAESN